MNTNREIDLVAIGGDGIGPEVVRSALDVLEATDVSIRVTEREAGDQTLEETGAALPDETLEAALEADAVLFGAAGETAADVIIRLRQELNTFVNLRPTPIIPEGEDILLDHEIVVVRENTEGLYVGREEETKPGEVEARRPITRTASERIARYAFEYAERHDRNRVSAIHKANVMKASDGLFLECTREIAEEYPDMQYNEGLVDATAMRLVMDPERFDVIVTTNLFGDILSDLIAGLVGGLGVCPSANIGDEHALFEPVHGSAPDIAGEGKANPSATILSASMMLDHFGFTDEADRINRALQNVIEQGRTTPDMGGTLSTADMTGAILDELS